MKLSDAFPSKFMKGVDIPTPRIVTISGVRQEEIGQKQELKYVLYCHNEPKGVVLGPTIWAQIAFAVGNEDSDRWTGKQIELFTELVRNPQTQQMVPGIRVRAPQQAQYVPPQQPHPANGGQYYPPPQGQPQNGGQLAPPQQQYAPPQGAPAQPQGNPANLVSDDEIPDPGPVMNAAQRAAYERQQRNPPF